MGLCGRPTGSAGVMAADKRVVIVGAGSTGIVCAIHLARAGLDVTVLEHGDLGGGSMELDQQLIFRPAPELCRHRTPLRGLYVSGASVHSGGSVHGMGGRSAARALLADRRLRPWRADRVPRSDAVLSAG